MSEPFRIQLAQSGPRQQSAFTCGSASLLVARMLLDPAFARWVRSGEACGLDLPTGCDLPARATEDERVAAFERAVLARTNALVTPAGRVQLPWPHWLGTPPWGARAELENLLGVASGVRYRIRWCRLGSADRLCRRHDELRARVGERTPALLYVGNAWLPRHVALVVPAGSGGGLDVYDPASGRLQPLPVERFAARRLGVAGWDVPWCAVLP